MGVLVDMVHPLCVEQGSPAFDAVYFVAFLQEKLGQVGAVLAGYAGDQGFFLS